MKKYYQHHLKQILEVAATTPGNWERFQAAGLIEKNSSSRMRSQRINFLSQFKLIDNWEKAFPKLEPINKQIIREQPGLFLAQVDDIIYRGMSSGTTGKYFTYFAGTEWNKKRLDTRHCSLQWWGITEKISIINVASRLLPVQDNDISLVGLIDQEFLQLLLSLIENNLSIIRGYPSRLCEVATYLYGKNLPQVKAVICTGECLFDYQRKLLKDVFNAPIINEYGCHETGISGFTCPEEGRLHLDSDRCFYEVIDGQLVTTDLFNYTMPLVRYQCGDIVDLDTNLCSCNRAGLTGKILGRIENQIRTIEGIKLAGEIVMPPLENILNYRVLRKEKNLVDIWIHPTHCEFSLEPLNNWIQNTFGDVYMQVFLDKIQPIETKKNLVCDAQTWIKNITQNSWSSWLQNPSIPSGDANLPAQLLKALINSKIITSSGIPATTQILLDKLLSSPLFTDSEVEVITARVLLFACSFLTGKYEITSLYYKAVNRLKNVLKLRSNDNAKLDVLIPTLYLDTEMSIAIWDENLDFNLSSLDTFNIHHLLVAFETAWQKFRLSQKQSSWFVLKPFLSLLIGDLNFFSSQFGTWLLAHWCQILQGISINLHSVKTSQNSFITAWLKWRNHLINDDKNTEIVFTELLKSATNPQEKARVMLEKGYGKIVKRQKLKPDEWLSIINTNASLLSQGLSENKVDLIPWIPILHSLVIPLFEQGERELAYQCLLTSTLSSSRYSNFERLARLVNDKQLVIFDSLLTVSNR